MRKKTAAAPVTPECVLCKEIIVPLDGSKQLMSQGRLLQKFRNILDSEGGGGKESG